MRTRKPGDLVLVQDECSLYNGEPAMVLKSLYYNLAGKPTSEANWHPDSYSCRLLLHKSTQCVTVRARFLIRLKEGVKSA